MYDFKTCLDNFGEIGEVSQVLHSVIYAKGLPSLRPNEIVIFESGQIGQAFSLLQDQTQILVLSHHPIKVGEKIARTNETLSVNVSDSVIGRVLDALGNPVGDGPLKTGTKLDINPPLLPLTQRKLIVDPLETGVSLADLIIPIGKGQRELVIGDRKTGKTPFFVKTIANQVKNGNICVYAAVGKKISEIKEMLEALKERNIDGKTIVVASNASDSPGMIFTAPYTAMTIAEYFRNKGQDVVIIIDDLTTHAMSYREISLLSGRFPGRNSYPGDIFYIHSKLLERGGNFTKGSITCFPVAISIMGDLSGYIQTNLMSITDGHIFFDTELATLGRRPAINPFLSVTRVGQQAQTPLLRDLSRELSSFLINLEKLREFLHFGAELSEDIVQKIKLGDRILDFFNQPADTIPINMSLLIMSMLWIGSWRDQASIDMKTKMAKMIEEYTKGGGFKKSIDDLVSKTASFADFLNKLREGNYGQEKYY